MSRALDNDVKEAIKNGSDHERVFESLAGVLSQRLPELLEIEFLGRSHAMVVDANTMFLQDGAAIAIPKLRLAQAFILARHMLVEHLAGREKRHQRDVLKATAVILLMDPEHLTAANTRKRVLVELVRKSAADASESLSNERYFVDSLLTSRLHRHTKSPTLWSHRQWLMERFQDLGLEMDAAATVRTVVFVAAERHPRNYYAWCHARYLVNGIMALDSREQREKQQQQQQQQQQLADVLAASKKWCFSHHDDVSGWAFLMFFLSRHPEHAAAVFSETLELAASFHWRNESVWYFLRNMLGRSSMGGGSAEGGSQEAEFHSTRSALLKGTGDETDERRILDRAMSWAETYHPSSPA